MSNFEFYIIGEYATPKKFRWKMGTDWKKRPLDKRDYIEIGRLICRTK